MIGRAASPERGRAQRVVAALLALLLLAAPATAQQLPALTGRVVDGAAVIPDDREAALTAKLEALQRGTSRQLVVVTVPNLQDQTVEDFAFRLGETWKIGDKEADNGAILLVALAEKKIRIEVGDGLEPILTDAMSGMIIRDTMRPRFPAGDLPGGIEAGVDSIIQQLQAPPEVAEQKALEAARRQAAAGGGGGGGRSELGSVFPLIFWGIVLIFVILPMLRGGRRGRRYRRRGGVFIWGPGFGSSWGGGSSWGSGGGGWGGGGGGGGFGGFSGGGGSFGGGGASGGW